MVCVRVCGGVVGCVCSGWWVQCGWCTGWSGYSGGGVEGGVCTVGGVYSVESVQCGVCTVWGVYSVGRVQCGACTVCGVYSVVCVQCGVCAVWGVYSVDSYIAHDCKVVVCKICKITHDIIVYSLLAVYLINFNKCKCSQSE